MQKNNPGFARAVVIVLLVALPAVLVLKFIFGVHITFINLQNKTALYVLVALWNACFAYFMFRVL
ncbi:hypothetical protein NBG4_10071 [Candidatus Sulfobium mesophilum]|uniref:Uncharacterized protein n=1 Tax=Candidatus Sulfobium mesophilum TaxID=2016548 RepID=A0A2U3QDP3_9BACT|nr:hypothetical protein NBG4_10071 [Candidatus Sulfobium mesophilum]